MTCPTLVDLGTISENYGQMTGVLAGFAFTALVLLLTPTQSDQRLATGRRGEGVPLAFFVAFITLVIATLLYSVLAGEPEASRPRAATEEMIDGVIFGLAVLILLYGVSLLMRNAGIEKAAVNISRILTIVIVPALAMYFIAQGAGDTVAARMSLSGESCSTVPPDLGNWLTAALAAVLSIALLPGPQKIAGRFASVFRVAAPLTVFVATVVGAVVSGAISARSPESMMSPSMLNAFLLGVFVLLVVVGLMLAFSEPLGKPATEAATQPASEGSSTAHVAGRAMSSGATGGLSGHD
jgi:hypothetical protein